MKLINSSSQHSDRDGNSRRAHRQNCAVRYYYRAQTRTFDAGRRRPLRLVRWCLIGEKDYRTFTGVNWETRNSPGSVSSAKLLGEKAHQELIVCCISRVTRHFLSLPLTSTNKKNSMFDSETPIFFNLIADLIHYPHLTSPHCRLMSAVGIQSHHV